MILNPLKAQFASGLQVDKILQIFSGSFTLAPTISGALIIKDNHATAVNDMTYFFGIYSVDGGNATDIGSNYLINNEFVNVAGGSKANSIGVYGVNFDSVSHNVSYEIAIMAKPSNTLYSAVSPPDNNLYLTSKSNYQKIALEGSQSVNIAAGNGTQGFSPTSVTIVHSLGYRPCVRSFVDDGTTLTDFSTPGVVTSLAPGRTLLSNTNAVLSFINNSASATYTLTLSHRIYYDPN